MKKLLKILKWSGIVIVTLIIVVVVFVQLSWDKKKEAPYPDIKASTDSSVIARGKYLAFGPAHCASCHTPIDKMVEVENGLQIPLSGGWKLEIAGLGTFRAPNLTPDLETGIGKLSDKDIARTLRYSVGSDGRLIFPFMAFQELSDEDLTAVVSFIRSQEPVKHEIERSEYGFLGKALIAFGLIKPEGPKNKPPDKVVIDTTIEYGRYLANNVANCRGCHSEYDMNTGKQTGRDFAGKGQFPPDEYTDGYAFVSPNLTPHRETGIMAHWSEETFIDRFKKGRVFKGSPMPWGTFSRMNETDLKALYRYLHSLEPVSNKVNKTVYKPGEKLPE
jgi:mono/diheme cytochrome c family protein